MRYLFDLTLPVYHWSLLFPLMVSTYYKSYIDHFSFFLICFKIAYPSHSCFFQSIFRSMFLVIIFFIPSIASASRSSFKLHFSVIFFSTSLLSLANPFITNPPSWRVVFWHTFSGVLHFDCPRFTYFPLFSPLLSPLSFSENMLIWFHLSLPSPPPLCAITQTLKSSLLASNIHI